MPLNRPVTAITPTADAFRFTPPKDVPVVDALPPV
jgi:hypothetical protein